MAIKDQPDDPEKQAAIYALINELRDCPLYFIRAFSRFVEASIDMNNGVKDPDPLVLEVSRRHHLSQLLRIGFPGEEKGFKI